MRKIVCILLAAMMALCASFAYAEESADSLAVLAEPHGFKMGTSVSYYSLQNPAYREIVKEHFNSITAENEMKAYSLLNQSASMGDPDGLPRMRFDQADAILDFAAANGIKVRGHVLTWDAYMTDWFFREGYRSNGAYVDAETMKQRMRSYIIQVVTHFEEKYPGVVYCWDVVNEAVGDSAADWVSGDPRHLRAKRNGDDNIFYKIVGNDYVELSFMYAREAVELTGADIKLFYNDYNAFMPGKREAICALVESINSYTGKKLCDGVGMQGYIGGYGTQNGCMNDGDIKHIKDAMAMYSGMGLEVQITEMAVRTYKNDEVTMQRHCEFYRKLFKLFKSVNRSEEKPLTCISLWGLVDCPSLPEDNYSYKLLSPYGGLYTEDLQPKEELSVVCDELKAE